MKRVSDEILTCFSTLKKSNVIILWSLSAIFIKITLTSSLILNSIFLKFSACMETRLSLLSLEIFVSPSTIFETSFPNKISTSPIVIFVSSTTSCNKAAIIDVAPSPISSETILATFNG